MAKLGEIVFGKMLVIATTTSGVPIRYLDIETGERINTSYGASMKAGRIISLSEKELAEVIKNLKIDKYVILSTIVKDQLESLLTKINQLIPNPRQKIKMSVVGYGIYDKICFYNDDPEELGIPSLTFPKEPTKIKLNPK